MLCMLTISFNFITGLLPMFFQVMDTNGDGTVDVQDMVSRYDVTQHPDVINGSRSKFEVLREFMDTFDGGNKDGIITPLEFAQYYG